MINRYKNNLLYLIIISARPWQWIKNSFVFAPLVFSKLLFDKISFYKESAAFLAFCFISSSIYLFNDIKDKEKDSFHPVNKFRPVASGKLSIPKALTASFLFALVGFSVGFYLSSELLWILISYALLNIVYTVKIKHIPYLDVVSIAVGFLLRITAGAAALKVNVSYWILINTFFLSTFLGFGKRFHEMLIIGEKSDLVRPVLKYYDSGITDALLLLLFSIIPLAFTGYVFYPASSNEPLYKLFLTYPFLIFALFRFYKLSINPSIEESPTESMLKDPLFVTSVTGWTLLAVYAVYGISL